MYWAASCGGCEVALVNIHEKILDVDAAFDLIFCPCLLDTKKKDIEAMPDKSIAITLFNGAIRTEENKEMAHLLRRKAQVLIAFGSCAHEGCIPGLSNLYPSREEHMKSIYLDNYSTDNPAQVVPQLKTEMPEGVIHLPLFFDRVKTLAQEVEVDYFIPGCPPESHQIWNVVDLVVKGGPLPPAGSVIGAGRSSVCDECDRKVEDKRIKKFYMPHEIIPERQPCLLDQGIICMGIATRDGCGALCPQVNMPCIGCYGPPEGIDDQGAKMVSAIGSVLDIGDTKGMPEDELVKRVDDIIGSIPDFAGTFYKFSLADSILKGKIK